MSLSLNDYTLNGEDWNLEWLNNHPNHYLTSTYKTLYAGSDIFASTCCEITSEMILEKEGFKEWVLLDTTNFEDVYKLHTFFRVTFGECWEDFDHTAIILNCHLIQSYYKQYKLRTEKVSEELISCFRDVANCDNYKRIVGVDTVKGDCKRGVYYWIPA